MKMAHVTVHYGIGPLNQIFVSALPMFPRNSHNEIKHRSFVYAFDRSDLFAICRKYLLILKYRSLAELTPNVDHSGLRCFHRAAACDGQTDNRTGGVFVFEVYNIICSFM